MQHVKALSDKAAQARESHKIQEVYNIKIVRFNRVAVLVQRL